MEHKILNQSLLLEKLNIGVGLLKPYYSNVKSGDTSNREGVAAKVYWKKLFGKEFIRDRIGKEPNNSKNLYVRYCSTQNNALSHKERIREKILERYPISIILVADKQNEYSYHYYGRRKCKKTQEKFLK